MEEYKKMWRNYFVFDGRSTVRDYWMSFLVNFVVSLIISIISTGLELSIIVLLYTVIVFIPNLALLCRRLHDTNRSGLWCLISLVPFVGWIIEIVMLCQPSVDEGNNYGNIVE